MIAAPQVNEFERIRALHNLQILDTPPENPFDHLTQLAARHFRVPVALVTFLDLDRQWFKSWVGTDVRETERKSSFCSYTILSDKVTVVPDALADPRFQSNAFVQGPSHVRSYIGAPLRTASGHNVGSFCLIDTRPRRFSVEQQMMLADLARIVVDELEFRRKALTHHAKERKRAEDLASSQIEILQRLARAAEFRDDDTGQHTQRVGHISALLAQSIGLSARRVMAIRHAAQLHDVGKIAISDLILLKPGKLTEEEMVIMRTHAVIGAQLLSDGRSRVVQMAERIAHSHHEHWDGKGYPQGLSGEAIPVEARILAVADVFDALTHARPYKKAWSVKMAVQEIALQGGRQFDPKIVEGFMTLDHASLL